MKILTDPRSGSYQGITSSRNRFGQYVRTRAIPVQPRTPRQGQVRGQFAVAAANWRGLTDAQRAGWNGMARNYRVTDSLGQSNPLNGFGFYTAAQIQGTQYAGAPFGPDAPTTLASFELDPGAYAIVMDQSSNLVDLTFSPSPTTTNLHLAVESTGPVSNGVQTPPGPQYWRQLILGSPPSTTPYHMATSYTDLFGPLVVGQRVFFRVAEYQDDTARRAAWATVMATVVA